MVKTKNEQESGLNRKGVRCSLSTKIIAIALGPVLVLAIALTLVGMDSIRKGMQEEILEKLKLMTHAMEGTVNALDEGDFALDAEENLVKGSYNLTQDEAMIDSLVGNSDTDITFFFDKTRRATTLKDAKTGERILGTDAGDAVYEKVVKNGKSMEATDLLINGKSYYAYYAPMKNSNGAVVGMYFAGSPSTDMNAYIMKQVGKIAAAAVVIGILALILILIVVIRIRKGILDTRRVVETLANGNLNIEIDAVALNRNDELGDMAREVHQLQKQLVKTLSKVRDSASVLMKAGNELSDMASQTSATADEISHAVEDISRGAVSQADEIETASGNVMQMGEVIARIVNGVSVLDTTSGQMENSRNSAMNIVNDLTKSNQKTQEAVGRIGEQIRTTNESANKISEAIQIISSIAEETNLLSLNASIEAARAGEQGKGFAVVANQIQKLAEQSNESSQRIADIIVELLQDSNKTVDVMREVEQIISEESDKLAQTRNEFGNVSRGIEQSRAETDGIKGQTVICDDSRKSVVDIISNLSAISQENAASTEETTASMQELNATINLLAESATDLTGLSDDLNQEIQFFKI